MYCPKCKNELKEDMIYCNKCGTKIRELYYNQVIDLEKVDLKNIDRKKLLEKEENENNVSFTEVIKQKLRDKGENEEYASFIINEFYRKYPLSRDKFYNIENEYEDKCFDIKQKFSISKYTDYEGNINIEFLDDKEQKVIENYNKEIEEVNLIMNIQIHNLLLDMLKRIEENFDILLNNAKINYQERQKNIKKNKLEIILNPITIAGIIVYIITVVCFWESFGFWTLILAPIIWIFIYIGAAVSNSAGTIAYGDKWNKMTPYEKDMQLRKDKIIQDLSNKKNKY